MWMYVNFIKNKENKNAGKATPLSWSLEKVKNVNTNANKVAQALLLRQGTCQDTHTSVGKYGLCQNRYRRMCYYEVHGLEKCKQASETNRIDVIL